jgi:hypothetical protein
MKVSIEIEPWLSLYDILEKRLCSVNVSSKFKIRFDVIRQYVTCLLPEYVYISNSNIESICKNSTEHPHIFLDN